MADPIEIKTPTEMYRSAGGAMKRAALERIDRHPARKATRRAVIVTGAHGWHYRRQLASLYAGAGLLTAGEVVSAVPHGGAGVFVFGAGAGGIAAVHDWLKTKHGHPFIRREAIHRWVTRLAGLSWLEATSVVGPVDGPMFLLLAAGLAGELALRRWKRRIPLAEAAPAIEAAAIPVDDEPAEVTMEVIPEAVREWLEYVNPVDGPLPKTQLVGVETARQLANPPHGLAWRADIELPRGKMTAEMAVMKTDLVASALATTPHLVNIEPSIRQQANLARISVYNEHPLRLTNPFPGPQVFDPDTGLASLGIYHDGEPFPYRFYQPKSGPTHDLFSGTTGSGKSQLTGSCLAIERHSPLMVSWVIDPQYGQSLPEWQGAVDWFAPTVPAGMRLLRALEKVVARRNAHMGRLRWTDEKGRERRGVGHFDPTPELPLLVVTIEEAHLLFTDPAYGAEALRIIGKMSKIARKCGIKLRVIVQVPLLSELGNSSPMRDMLASGTVVVLRTASRIVGQVAFQGALPVDPVSLPRNWADGSTTAGLGYVLGASTRAAQMRVNYVEDMFHWASLPGAGQLDAMSAQAAGEDYATWRDRYEQDLDEADGSEPSTPASRPPLTVVAGSRSSASTESIGARALGFLRANGSQMTGVIARELDEELAAVGMALGRMRDRGEVVHVKRGLWAAADRTEDEVSA